MAKSVDIFLVIEKMAMLVLLMVIGYACAKLKITGPESNRHASRLVMNVLLVGTILNSVVNITPSLTNSEIFMFFGLMLVEFAVLGIISWAAPNLLRIKGSDKGVAMAVLLFMNNGFVGFPVIEVVFGTEAVFYASLSNIPFNILLYTIGMMQLSGGASGQKISFKSILTTPMVATIAAIALFFLRVRVPLVLADTISSLAAATIPMSMLIIGTSLGNISLKSAFGDWRAYALSFIKLIICPIAVWAVLKVFISNELMIGILVILAACPTAMVLTVLCVQHQLDEALSSKTIFLSTVFSAVTIPFIVWLLL